ncbi:hypothetical protein DL95DRAFT_472099 [Leptodontidium sp. 2 PMI_412]|nr:hypothetical protein DL95DRAFT_472099 [Leptodontidium sp. 2 PMI_412]
MRQLHQHLLQAASLGIGDCFVWKSCVVAIGPTSTISGDGGGSSNLQQRHVSARVLLILNTGAQLSAERARNQRVEHTINRGLRKEDSSARKKREQQGAFWRASQRLKQMRDPFDDSEEDGDLSIPPLPPFRTQGLGGLMQLKS